jgi:Domain of unknown function (DUF4396)
MNTTRAHRPPPSGWSLNRSAVLATAHCLTGCAIGEVLGLVLATAFGWSNLRSIVLAVALAFTFGYGLSLRPIVATGISFRRALGLALAADTVSIATMELVDNGVVLAVPGAMEAGLANGLFWWSLALGLALAFIAATPVNRALIARGRGHARVHEFHHSYAGSHGHEVGASGESWR